jgi:hypothetical protein
LAEDLIVAVPSADHVCCAHCLISCACAAARAGRSARRAVVRSAWLRVVDGSADAVVEGKRAIWQVGQVEVYDGGSDGPASTTSDNTDSASSKPSASPSCVVTQEFPRGTPIA